MTAASAYAALVDAVDSQRAHVLGVQPGSDTYTGQLAQLFRFDSAQELDADRAVLASYIERNDTLLDVGGGAGRLSLPLALRCRQLINVDPSLGMQAEFEASAAANNILNARFIPSDWVAAESVEGDVTLVAHVTYFVPDIVPFIEKLAAVTRRRVLLLLASVPPPNQAANFFRLVYGEEQAPAPGHRELLAVLWDMGILPDIRVLPGPSTLPAMVPLPTRAAAIDRTLLAPWLGAADRERARPLIDAQFDDLYVSTPKGFVRRGVHNVRELLITWDTSKFR